MRMLLGAATSRLIVRVSDRLDRPLAGIRVQADAHDSSFEMMTDADGLAVFALPFGPTQVVVSVDLPEGVAQRLVNSSLSNSGKVEIFQSMQDAPKPVVTLGEALAFLLGSSMVVTGLMMKDGKAEDVLIGIGSGMVGVSGFSFVWRHLS